MKNYSYLYPHRTGVDSPEPSGNHEQDDKALQDYAEEVKRVSREVHEFSNKVNAEVDRLRNQPNGDELVRSYLDGLGAARDMEFFHRFSGHMRNEVPKSVDFTDPVEMYTKDSVFCCPKCGEPVDPKVDELGQHCDIYWIIHNGRIVIETPEGSKRRREEDDD